VIFSRYLPYLCADHNAYGSRALRTAPENESVRGGLESNRLSAGQGDDQQAAVSGLS
jgi:hypothetical protein